MRSLSSKVAVCNEAWGLYVLHATHCAMIAAYTFYTAYFSAEQFLGKKVIARAAPKMCGSCSGRARMRRTQKHTHQTAQIDKEELAASGGTRAVGRGRLISSRSCNMNTSEWKLEQYALHPICNFLAWRNNSTDGKRLLKEARAYA